MFEPTTYQQAAGLTTYYNRNKFHFAAVSWTEEQGRCLMLMSCPGDWPDGRMQFPAAPVPLVALLGAGLWLRLQQGRLRQPQQRRQRQ